MKSLLTLQQRLLLLLCVGVVAGTLISWARMSGWLQPAELWQYDITTAALVQPETLPDVTLVGLTDGDLAKSGWPISDAHLTNLVTAALDGGARTVGVDLYRDVPVGDGRAELIGILQDPRVVVISRLPGETSSGVFVPDGVQTGFADVPIDPDGVTRRALILVNSSDGLEFSFPLKLAMNFTGQTELRADKKDRRVLAFGSVPVPPLELNSGPYTKIDTSGYQVMARYRHAPPLVRRIGAESLIEDGGKVSGQLVLIGTTSDTVKDYFLTPLNRRTGADFTFGAEVHAAIAQQLIDYAGDSLKPFRSLPEFVTTALIFAWAFAGAGFAVLWPARVSGLLAGLSGALLIVLVFSAAQNLGWLMPSVPFSLAWTISFTTAFALLAVVARRHRRIMAELFASQLSPGLSSEIWSQRRRLLEGRKPIPRKLFVTVLLADIEGSTNVGGGMEADAFMNWISRLLDNLSRIAQDHGGFVEKFTGDGILVVFGAPVPAPGPEGRRKDAKSAVACAQMMQRTVLQLNSRNLAPFYSLRVALNSGEVVAGTLGVPGAMRYNIIGDPVNVASRVENLIKTFDADENGMRPIAMTATTAALLDDKEHQPTDHFLLHDDGETEIEIHFARQ